MGFITVALSQDIGIDLLIRRQNFENPFKNNPNVIVHYAPLFPFKENQIIKPFLYTLKLAFTLVRSRSKVVIGCDMFGLLYADFLRSVSLGYFKIVNWSFEIYFEDELSKHPQLMKIKRDEKRILASVKIIVIQDKARGKLFGLENRIKENVRWHYVPVSPLIKQVPVNDKLKNKEIKILVAGSLGKWVGMDMILEAIIKTSNKNLHFTFHDNLKFTTQPGYLSELLLLKAAGYPVTVSDSLYLRNEDYLQFLTGFDVGLALYVTNYEFAFWGKNIEEIGLSSGKISFYACAGLAIYFSNTSVINLLNQELGFGKEITESSSLVCELDGIDLERLLKMKVASRKLYDLHLNPQHGYQELLTTLVY